MLSGETAKGKYPQLAVETMTDIIREAEAAICEDELYAMQQMIMPRPAQSMEAVAAASARTAQDQGASLIMVLTETGAAPALIAKYRPAVPVVAVCHSAKVARQCALLCGVVPIVVRWNDGSEFATVSVRTGCAQWYRVTVLQRHAWAAS